MAKKVRKIIDKKYIVKNDGKNCIYVQEENSTRYIYAELDYTLGLTRIRLGEVGLKFYFITKKQNSRFVTLLGKGNSVYLKGVYRYIKTDQHEHRT